MEQNNEYFEKYDYIINQLKKIFKWEKYIYNCILLQEIFIRAGIKEAQRELGSLNNEERDINSKIIESLNKKTELLRKTREIFLKVEEKRKKGLISKIEVLIKAFELEKQSLNNKSKEERKKKDDLNKLKVNNLREGINNNIPNFEENFKQLREIYSDFENGRPMTDQEYKDDSFGNSFIKANKDNEEIQETLSIMRNLIERFPIFSSKFHKHIRNNCKAVSVPLYVFDDKKRIEESLELKSLSQLNDLLEDKDWHFTSYIPKKILEEYANGLKEMIMVDENSFIDVSDDQSIKHSELEKIS